MQAVPSSKTGKRMYDSAAVKPDSALTVGTGGVVNKSQERPFDKMNNLVANLLLNMTRFVGPSFHVEK